MADINLNIALSIQQATADIKRFSEQAANSLGSVEKAAKSVEKEMGAVGKNTSASIQALSTAVGVGLYDAFKSVTSSIVSFGEALVSDAVNSAIEAEDAQNQLNTALRISGRLTEDNVKALSKQAEALSSVTKFADNQITSTQAQIQTLARLDSDGLQRATKATLDLASAFNKDLGEAAQIVGRAAEGNITALNKMGIEVKKGKTDAETFGNVLQVLESRFKDVSLASANTFSGALALANNSIDKAKESLGLLIIQNPAVVTGIKQLGVFALELNDIFNKNTDAITGLINEGISVLAKSFIFAVDIIRFFVEGLDGLRFAINLGITKFIEMNFVIVEAFAKSGQALGKFVGLSSSAIDSVVNDLSLLSQSAKAVSDEDFKNAAKTAEDRAQLYEQITAAAEKASNLTIAATTKETENRKQAYQSQAEAAAILATSQKEKNEEYLRIQQETLQKELEQILARNELLRSLNTEKSDAELEANAILFEAKLTQLDEFENTYLAKQIEALEARNAAIAESHTQAAEQELAANQTKINQLTAQQQNGSDKQLAIVKARKDKEAALTQATLQNYNEFFGNLASLTRTKNAELFAIGKAAAYAQAVVNVAQGITKALAQGGVFGPILAASVAVAGAVQIATISAQQLATGITEVPSGFNNDNFPALLTSGERVLSVDQNKDLKSFMANGGNGASDQKLDEINSNLVAAMNRPVVVQVGGREIFRVVQDEINAGRVLST